MSIHFSGVSVTSTSIDFYIKSDAGSGEAWADCYIRLASGGGFLQVQSFHVTDGNDVIVRFTGLTPNTAYTAVVPSLGISRWALTSSGGGTSGGGSSSGSWSGGSQTKTNTASWTPSTTAGTCAYNYADACWDYGTVSCNGNGTGSWYGYSWAYACLESVVETDYDVTYRIRQGGRTKNIADWPYHGLTIKYTDTDNVEQTVINYPATSTGNYWANAYLESNSYNYVVNNLLAGNVIEITYVKSLSAAYTRQCRIRFYNDHSYWCNLGGMYQWENKLNINLQVPKRTKYRAGVHGGLGGTAYVNNTNPCVYVNSGTNVTYSVTMDEGITFRGWYLPTNVTADQAVGYVANLGATPVSTSTSYTKSITSDYELVAVFEGYNPPADWTESTSTSNVFLRSGGNWKRVQPYVKDSNAWGKATIKIG